MTCGPVEVRDAMSMGMPRCPSTHTVSISSSHLGARFLMTAAVCVIDSKLPKSVVCEVG